MADDNGINERILDAVLELGPRLSGVEIEVKGCVAHLASIDRRLEAGSSQLHSHGTQIAQQGQRIDQLQHQLDEQDIAAQGRRRRCSEQFRELGARFEDTGKHVVAINGERRGVRLAAGVVLAVLTLTLTAIGTFQLGQCRGTNHNGAAATKPAPKR